MLERLAIALIVLLLLVTDDLTIQCMNQRVNGGVHIGIGGFDEQITTIDVYIGFHVLVQLLDRKDDADINGVIKVSFDALQFVHDIVPDGWGNFDMLSCNRDIHFKLLQ